MGHIEKLAHLFTERELRLIRNCRTYAGNDPAGLPGHNLMILVAKLDAVFEEYANEVNFAVSAASHNGGDVTKLVTMPEFSNIKE